MDFWSDTRFWTAWASLAVLSIVWFVYPRQSPIKLGWRIWITAVAGPGAVVLLVFTGRAWITRALPSGGSGSQSASGDTTVVLGFFSVVATLVGGYAFYIVNSFARQRGALEDRIRDAEILGADADSRSTRVEGDFARSQAALDLNLRQFSSYLKLERSLRNLDPKAEGISEMNHASDLALVETLVLRNEWGLIAFDLEEILLLAKGEVGRFADTSELLVEYLSCILAIDSPPVTGEAGDRTKVEQGLAELVNLTGVKE